MEAIALLFLFVFYVLYKILFAPATQLEKDNMRLSEGIAHIKAKEWEKARTYFNEATINQSDCALAWSYLGVAYYHQDDFETALACLHKAGSLDNLSIIFRYKGKIAYNENNYQLALREFDKAVWYDRNDAESYRMKALVLKRIGEYELAYDALKISSKLGDELSSLYLQQMFLPTKKRF